ncbi:MAG: DMT family transporter [Hyphomicrobiaceae bacterium]|nr:DMT family transporter [Hyphomicrobiaceae bacterium]
MSRLTATLLLVAAMALVGANVPFGKALVAELPLLPFMVYRFALSSAALALLLPLEPPRSSSWPSVRQIGGIAAMSLVGMVMFTLLMLEGLRRTSSIDAGVITATMPAVVALLGLIVHAERPGVRRLFAIALAAAGIAIVSVSGAATGERTLIGNLLVGGAVLCEAAFVLMARQLSRDLPPIRLSLAANLAGLAIVLPPALPELATLDLAAVRPGMWALATWYVLAASVFALLLWYRGLPHVETSLAGLATVALPLTALAVAVLWLGEPLAGGQIAGGALAILAIVLAAREPAHPVRPPAASRARLGL